MSPKVVQLFTLASGGLIPDVPQNQKLIKLIKNAKQLSPKQLLELADFYQENRTLTSLVDHLDLIAAAKLLALPELEDIWNGFDPTPEEDREKLLGFLTHARGVYKGKYSSTILVEYAKYEIKCISSLLPGLGLLIETSDGQNPYVLGVCPALNS